MIRLGVCTGIENAGRIKSIGYDYIEPALNAVAAMEEKEFSLARAAVEASGLACEALNCMLPGEIPVTGPQVDESKVQSYLARAYARAAALGAKVLVFGSGGSRGVPEGFDRGRAWRQIRDFLVLASGIAEEHGLKIAIEPLRRAECNILNTVSEAAELAGLLNLPQTGVLGDTYHMYAQGESLDALPLAGGLLWHVHMAEPKGRRFPRSGDGQNYGELFQTLEAAGYQGRVSIEAGTEDLFADAEAAFALLDGMRRHG